MAENKKEWITPELIVLVRSKPEEAVLAVCKLEGDFRNGPRGWVVMCYELCALPPCFDLSAS